VTHPHRVCSHGLARQLYKVVQLYKPYQFSTVSKSIQYRRNS